MMLLLPSVCAAIFSFYGFGGEGKKKKKKGGGCSCSAAKMCCAVMMMLAGGGKSQDQALSNLSLCGCSRKMNERRI